MKPIFLSAFVLFFNTIMVEAGTGPGGTEKNSPVVAKMSLPANVDTSSIKISAPADVAPVSARGKMPHVTFSIQLYASKQPCNIGSKKFKDIPNVKEYKDGDLFIYYSGNFLSYYDALNVQKMITEYCFNDAFVIAFEEDKKVNVNYALTKVVNWWSK